jgi:Flp pilus assembly protein TadG
MRFRTPARRRGVTLVETTMVISLMMLFLLGVFEYGRFIAVLQVVENATREGARMGIAHTNDKVTSDVVARITDKLAGVDYQLTNLQISVGGQILRPSKPGDVAGTAFTDWTQASTTDGVAIVITAEYKPVVPTFLRMNSVIKLRAQSIMYSEGN